VPHYLADSSIWAWSRKHTRRDIAEKLAQRLERGEVCTCVPVALEVLHRAETGSEYEVLLEDVLAPLEWLPLTKEISDRALDVQRELAATFHGNHRRPAVDYLISAIAEAAGRDVVLWFFDKDMEVICNHTGQRCEAEASTGPGH
jgi:predicted nucleic acid-binding protein